MILNVISWCLVVLLGVPTLYLFVFAVASKLFRGRKPEASRGQRSYAIVIPAYKSDRFIFDTAKAAIGQNYPADKFRVLVAADSMSDASLEPLEGIGVEYIKVSFENSSKIKSLRKAMEHLGPDAADEVVILDSDNIVGPDFLSKADELIEAGAVAIQAHRTAKNTDTPVAVIDAAAEEINNSIFRKGHCALGISSALIGSGMILPYRWFCDNIGAIETSAEDKEIELALLGQGIYVDYAAHIPVLDEKTRTAANYKGQRRRWQASSFYMLTYAAKGLGTAKDRIGYLDKMFQWCIPSRMILLAAVPLLAIAATLAGASNAATWWSVVAALIAANLIALPGRMYNRELLKSLVQLPVLAAISVGNMFHLKGTKEKFIHTEH